MLQLKTSGKPTGGREYNPITSEVQKALNGKSLASAVEAGIIANDDNLKFARITGIGRNGDYELVVLGTNKGDVRLSSTLAEGGLADHVETLGDLVFNIGISTQEGAGKGMEYFRLQVPGNLNQTREEIDVTKMSHA